MDLYLERQLFALLCPECVSGGCVIELIFGFYRVQGKHCICAGLIKQYAVLKKHKLACASSTLASKSCVIFYLYPEQLRAECQRCLQSLL